MAAVTYTAGTIREYFAGEAKVVYWLSPDSMDSNDTVVVPTITGKTPYTLGCWDQTTGDAVTATRSTQTFTLDASGGTTNHIYLLWFIYI